MAKTNIFFANWICSVNLVCLVIADVMHINTIWFRKGSLCIMINASTFVAFKGCLVFKTYHVICVVLKIIFPFEHQCRWLRLTIVRSSLPWILLTSLYTCNIMYRYNNNGVFLDQLCSFGDCLSYTMYKDDILLAVAAAIPVVCLVLEFASATSFIISIKNNSAQRNLNKGRSLFKVKICSPIFIGVLIKL